MKLKKGKLYHIKWHDTVAIEQWCDWESIVEKAKENADNQESVGYYAGEAHDYHILASTINNSESMLPYANIALIPKGCIKKIKAL